MAKKKRKAPFSFQAQLSARMVFNGNITTDMEGDDFIRLKVNLKYTGIKGFFAKIFNVRTYRKYVLSGYGFRFFDIIRKSSPLFIDLVNYMRNTEKLSFFEARAIVLTYTGLLMERGIIAAEIPKEENVKSC